MATISVVLNDQQRKKIIHDMNEQVEMLTDIEIEYLATKLNENVNIPFLKENKEQIILAKLVKKVDRYLYASLPNELYECINDTKDGISDEEAEELKEILTDRANSNFNIKYLPENIEKQIFSFLIDKIVNAMRKKMSLL